MDLILDTHTAIWFITDDDQLPSFSKLAIQDAQNVCYVSIATLWERGIKYSLAKLELNAELKKVFELFFESGLILLPVTPDHILTNTVLPFDRLIIAQAKHEGFTIISKDQEFEKYDVNLIWTTDKSN